MLSGIGGKRVERMSKKDNYIFYVYLLKLKGVAIYAGVTTEPITRYKSHYYSDFLGCDYIRYLAVQHKEYVTMDIIFCSHNVTTAYQKEWYTISQLVRDGNTLYNAHLPKQSDKRVPKDNYPKVRLPYRFFTFEMISHVSENIKKARSKYNYV